MKRFSLALIAIIFGIIVFLMAFRRIIYWPLFIPLLFSVAFWYVVNFYISDKMIRKARAEDDYLYIACKMRASNEEKEDLIYGALTITASEIIFYKRKNWNGGVEIVYSNSSSALDGFEIGKIEEVSKTEVLKLSFSNEKHPLYFASKKFRNMREEIEKALNW